MSRLTTDVEGFIARRFGAEDREAALALCRSATIYDGSPAETRLIRCALVSSGGSLDKLRSEIARLAIDYRDVIVSGEYAPRGGQLVRVRNLNESIPDDA
jgi:hypothetical protein